MTQSITKYVDLKKEDESLARVQCLADIAIYEKAESAIIAYDEKILVLATAKDSRIDPRSIKKAQARKQKRAEAPKEKIKPMAKTLKDPISKQVEIMQEKVAKIEETKVEAQQNIEAQRLNAYANAPVETRTAAPAEDISKYQTTPIPQEANAPEAKKSQKEIQAELAAEKERLEQAKAQAQPARKLDIGG